MNRIFLADCPQDLKNSLAKDTEVLENFLSLNYFNQRSAAIYVANSKNKQDRLERIQHVVDSQISYK